MITREQVLQLQKRHGVPPHQHSNGLMSCSECTFLVTTGKTLDELSLNLCYGVAKESFNPVKAYLFWASRLISIKTGKLYRRIKYYGLR